MLGYRYWNGIGFEHGPLISINHGSTSITAAETPANLESAEEESSNADLIQFYVDIILVFGVIPLAIYYLLPPSVKYAKSGIKRIWAQWQSDSHQ